MDIFEETRELVERSMIPYSKISNNSGIPANWILRFMNQKADTPNLAKTKELNKYIKDHFSNMQG